MMKNIILFSILLLLIATSITAQKEANIWYFGHNAGLDFNSGSPLPLTDSALNTDEGCASISDSNGQLLFYTDGSFVWNKEHNQMPNGHSLTGHISSTQSAIIVPRPGSTNTYYIFTVDYTANNGGLAFSEVDMDMEGGLGNVTTKNTILNNPSCEKLSAVLHENKEDIWVIGHDWESNNYLAWLVTSSGIEMTPVISSVGSYVGADGVNDFNAIGYLKPSPNGDRIAAAHWYGLNVVEIFDFDNSTGILSNPIQLSGFTSAGCYGVEFAPESPILYVSERTYNGYIYQYDLSSNNQDSIQNSKLTLAQFSERYGAIQLGPDGKIYVAKKNNLYLDVIENPDVLGLGCNYLEDTLFLEGGLSWIGLPSFISSYFSTNYFSYEGICIGHPTSFTLDVAESSLDSVNWNFGDPISGLDNFSTELNPIHSYSSAGTYEVVLITFDTSGLSDTSFQNITLELPPIAGFDYLENGLATFDFIDQSQNANTYFWDFGDGTTSTNFEPTHTYTQNGNYIVQQIVKNGCSIDTFTKSINLVPTETDIVFGNGEGCTPFLISFSDTSNTNIDSYEWTFDGGIPSVSTDPNPEIYYVNPGVFDVQLIISNSLGSDTIFIENGITIFQEPIASYDYSIDENTVTFSNTSIYATEFIWDFGDGSSASNDVDPIHEYSAPGSYDVTLTALLESCDSIFSETILIEVVSTKNIETFDINIYPNPVEDILRIETDLNGKIEFDIFSIDGKKIEHFSDSFYRTTSIDLQNIPSGVYILTLSNKEQSLRHLFVKM